MTATLARDLAPEDMVDIPAQFVLGTDNEIVQQYEYATIESVGGGWADALAGPGEVVLYVPTWVSPVVIPGDATVTVVDPKNDAYNASPKTEPAPGFFGGPE